MIEEKSLDISQYSFLFTPKEKDKKETLEEYLNKDDGGYTI